MGCRRNTHQPFTSAARRVMEVRKGQIGRRYGIPVFLNTRRRSERCGFRTAAALPDRPNDGQLEFRSISPLTE
jgi:hypothetical protein